MGMGTTKGSVSTTRLLGMDTTTSSPLDMSSTSTDMSSVSTTSSLGMMIYVVD